MGQENLFDIRPPRKLNVLPQNPEANDPEKAVGLGRFPSWLHRSLPSGSSIHQTGKLIAEGRLHTVCEEAKCPNLLECWSHNVATFLVMGKACTRNCGFCDIDFTKQPLELDADEPSRVAQSAIQLGLKHIVITMVARDDLPDGGAGHLKKIVEEIRLKIPEATVELLTSDFSGNSEAWDAVIQAKPEIFNHNIETVRALTPRVRHKATYERTLELLRYVREKQTQGEILIKSGLMVGLGESEEEVLETIRDLHTHGCQIITIGQYLQASSKKLLVKRFVTPEEFKRYEEFGYKLGVKYMYCGPFVRSSYNAGVVIQKAKTITSR